MTEHALLSASGSERWLNCPPSARLEQKFPQETSSFAEEGTFAHALSEQQLAAYIKTPKKPLPAELMRYDNQDLRDAVSIYVEQAKDRIDEARSRSPDALILLERRLDLSKWIPQGFGTGDLITVSDGVLTVDDLKFGKGIRVTADNNSQLRLYGAGALNMCSPIFEIQIVRLTIVQPRLNHTSTEEISAAALLDWADREVTPKAALAWQGKGDFFAGEHCRFCKARVRCSARAQANLDLARLEFERPEIMSDESIAHVITKAADLRRWANDIEGYALSKALQGRKWPGLKLVEGKSKRKFVDPEAVACTLSDAGVDSDVIWDRNLHSPTAIERSIGKKRFAELLGQHPIKTGSNPTLVPAADKRPEITPTADFSADFFTQQEPPL